MLAPASRTRLGDLEQERSSPSMAQGPAIIARWPPPILTPLTSKTESSGWNSRLASLYGLRIGTTCSTPAIAWSGSTWSFSSSPMTPMIVRETPWLRCGVKPELLDPLQHVLDRPRASSAASGR